MVKEKKRKILKIIAFIIIFFIIAFFINFYVLAIKSYDPNRQIDYGVTFSPKFAEYLGLDWQEAYLALLEDLDVKYIRIPTYWEKIEPIKGQYDFKQVDWMINEAEKNDARVILVIGRRQPRWPECHDPVWLGYISKEEQRKRLLKNIETVVNRYKQRKIIEIWQIENEPFLDFFGECPHMTKKELREEIDLVKSLDKRKILITDSGELSSWYPAIKMGDLFGTTLYRMTYNRYIGYWHYFFVPASFYRVKAYIWQKPQVATYIAELQAEPWFPEGPLESPVKEHYKSMNAEQLKKNAEYANKTNFERAYFWGAEWWYWLKTMHEDASVWETARQYFE